MTKLKLILLIAVSFFAAIVVFKVAFKLAPIVIGYPGESSNSVPPNWNPTTNNTPDKQIIEAVILVGIAILVALFVWFALRRDGGGGVGL